MSTHQNALPRLLWGRDCAAKLGPLLPSGKVAIVSGVEAFRRSRLYPALLSAMNHLELRHFPGCPPNPGVGDAAELGRALSRFAPQTVVAVGGGSVIDIAKLARIGHVPDSLLVAVPTTAGSGSEATAFASLTIVDNGVRKKISYHDPALLPSLVVLDPLALESLSLQQRAVSGMDALSQALESYWSVRSVRRSEGFALRALRLIRRAKRAYLAGDSDAAATMQWAAYLSGKAIAITATNSCHAISYPLTVSFGVPHGWAVGLTLPHLLRWNAPVLNGKAARLCCAMEMSSVSQIAQWIEGLQQQSGLPLRLRAWDITRADLQFIVQNSYRPDRMFSNPRFLRPEDLHRLLQQIL